jgi:hypothetical protein
MPKGQYDRASSAWSPKPLVEYPEDLVSKVRELYESGLTMRETAAAAGTTVKVLQRLMPRHGIDRRPAIKRDQTGEKNDSWKGDQATYNALHLRVYAARGRPDHCSCCGRSDGGSIYEWANQTGKYTDVNDYEQMCASCHRSLDALRRRLTGRNTMPANGRGDV